MQIFAKYAIAYPIRICNPHITGIPNQKTNVTNGRRRRQCRHFALQASHDFRPAFIRILGTSQLQWTELHSGIYLFVNKQQRKQHWQQHLQCWQDIKEVISFSNRHRLKTNTKKRFIQKWRGEQIYK